MMMSVFYEQQYLGGGRGHGPMASVVARAYNGRLGAVFSKAPPPEAEAMEAANLPTFLKFGNVKNHIFVSTLQKIIGDHKTRGVDQKWGPVPPLARA